MFKLCIQMFISLFLSSKITFFINKSIPNSLNLCRMCEHSQSRHLLCINRQSRHR